MLDSDRAGTRSHSSAKRLSAGRPGSLVLRLRLLWLRLGSLHRARARVDSSQTRCGWCGRLLRELLTQGLRGLAGPCRCRPGRWVPVCTLCRLLGGVLLLLLLRPLGLLLLPGRNHRSPAHRARLLPL